MGIRSPGRPPGHHGVNFRQIPLVDHGIQVATERSGSPSGTTGTTVASSPPPQRPAGLKGGSLTFEPRDLGAQTANGERQEQYVATVAGVV